MLICMGMLNRMIEVTKDKKEIVWDGFYDYEGVDTAFRNSVPLYRVHYISSLYPCYFTVQKNENNTEIQIFNEGTNNDSYNVNFLTASGESFKKSNTEIVESNKSVKIKIDPKSFPANTKKIIVSVISDTNTDLKKNLTIDY